MAAAEGIYDGTFEREVTSTLANIINEGVPWAAIGGGAALYATSDDQK